MKILLIGGTGVLSSAVVEEAIHKDMDVTIITRGQRKIPSKVTSIICDKNDYNRLSILIKNDYDAVIDFLCYSKDELERSFEFFSQYSKQYFFISSAAVYAKGLEREARNEDSSKVQPGWQYSVDKWAAEEKLMELAQNTNCKYTIIRPSVTYGDTRIPYGIYPQYGYHWTLCARIIAGKPIITWNKGENRCNMMRVEDFAIGLVGLIGNEKAYNEAFNVCGDERPSWREVLQVVEKYLGKQAVLVDMPAEFYAQQIPYRAGELLEGRAKDGSVSNAKLKSIVPEFKQTISIKEGVHKTLDAYKLQNYQRGIDWAFDAETDRIIEKWSKQNGISTCGMNLHFVDYLGMTKLEDKMYYSKIRYKDSKYMCFVWRVVTKLYKLYSKCSK